MASFCLLPIVPARVGPGCTRLSQRTLEALQKEEPYPGSCCSNLPVLVSIHLSVDLSNFQAQEQEYAYFNRHVLLKNIQHYINETKNTRQSIG